MKATEEFWKGDFGNAYNERNQGMVSRNAVFFARALLPVMGLNRPSSVLELGCGTGQNLEALQMLLGKQVNFGGIEINEQAAKACKVGTIFNSSLLAFKHVLIERLWDLVVTKGVLIHQPPEDLPAIYHLMWGASSRYIFIAEYYNPTPVEIPYRGHDGVLWKRDFAGELMDQHPDVKLVDTGFAYHRAPQPQDDLTWFLLEKQT